MKRYSTILQASYHNDYHAIADLLDSNNEIENYVNYKERQTEYTALMYAILHKNIPIIKLLLQHGANVFDDDYDILDMAKTTKNDEIIRLITYYQSKNRSKL